MLNTKQAKIITFTTFSLMSMIIFSTLLLLALPVKTQAQQISCPSNIISGHVYLDGTINTGGFIYVVNISNNSILPIEPVEVANDGSYSFDLGNLIDNDFNPICPSIGDTIYITGFDSSENFISYLDYTFAQQSQTNINVNIYTGAPSVISSNPTNNTTNVPIDSSVSVTFNHEMTYSSINGTDFIIYDSENNVVSGDFSYNKLTNTSTFTPYIPFAPGVTYTANLNTDILDVSYNALNPYSFSFSTVAPSLASTSITSFNFTDPSVTGIVDNAGNAVYLSVPFGTQVSALTPTITLPAGENINPQSGVTQDFTNPVTYTVTASDGVTTMDYIVIVIVDPASVDTSIVSFNLSNPVIYGIVNTNNGTIELNVPFGTDVTALVPNIALTNGATILPSSGASQDFTNPITYTVTAQDGLTTQSYTVSVNVASAPMTAPSVTAIPSSSDRIDLSWTASTGGTAPITYNVYRDNVLLANTSYTALSDLALSANTTFTYIIEAVDALNNLASSAPVSATTLPSSVLSSDTSITLFDLSTPSVIGIIDSINHNIALTVPFETNLTALIPNIFLASGATISPDTGIAQDFTNPVTYTVTAQDGVTTQIYTVTIAVAPAILMPPTNVVATPSSTTVIDLSWTSATGGVNPITYYILRNDISIATTSGSTYQDIGLTASTTYTYHINAMDNVGTLVTSTPVSTTTIPNTTTVTPPTGGGGGGGGGYYNPPFTVPASGLMLSINNRALSTNDRRVMLSIYGGNDAVKMMVSNNADFSNSPQQPYTTSLSWNLTDGNGTKTVYIKFFNASGNSSVAIFDNIVLNEAGKPSSNQNGSSSGGQVLGVTLYANNLLLRTPSGKIYFTVNGGKRYISNLNELKPYRGTRMIQVDNELLNYPNALPYANGVLLRTPDFKIFSIINGQKHHILNLTELKQHYGKKLYNVSNSVIIQFPNSNS